MLSRLSVLLVALALGYSPALAQGITTRVAAPTDGGTPISAAQAAAMQPQPCTTIPAADTYGGSMGTGTPCLHRQDASRPTQVQPANAQTASDGTFSGNWKVAFSAQPTTVIAQANTIANPYICQATATVSGFSGKCWQVVANTLPTTLTALYGLVVSPVQNPAAGIPVSVVARQ